MSCRGRAGPGGGARSRSVPRWAPAASGCCATCLGKALLLAAASRDRGDLTLVRHVSPGYFTTMRIALKRGRLLDEHERGGANGAVVINEGLARPYFAGEDPIGRYSGRARARSWAWWPMPKTMAWPRPSGPR